MRNAVSAALYELAKKDERIVVVVADISPAGAMEDFRREFPRRFVNVGVAEQSMIGLAAGLAQRGFRPFCYTIATFALFRAYEFVRCDLAYQDLPVTVVGMGAGLCYSTLGGTHQAIEDVAVAMACPNLTVLAPCDPAEAAACARWCGEREGGGPVYLRIGKAGEPDLTSELPPWQVGVVRHWCRVGAEECVVSYGSIAAEARDLAEARGADLALQATLTEESICVLASQLSGYSHLVVVEEASGAPLTRQLASWIRWMRPGVRVTAFAPSSAFPRLHGSHWDLLEAAGLTADKMAEALSRG